jgi:hypothetical protein
MSRPWQSVRKLTVNAGPSRSKRRPRVTNRRAGRLGSPQLPTPSPGGFQVGSAQHRHLMAQDHQFRILGGRRAGEQDQPTQQPNEDQIEQAKRHNSRSCRASERPESPPVRDTADFWDPTGFCRPGEAVGGTIEDIRRRKVDGKVMRPTAAMAWASMKWSGFGARPRHCQWRIKTKMSSSLAHGRYSWASADRGQSGHGRRGRLGDVRPANPKEDHKAGNGQSPAQRDRPLAPTQAAVPVCHPVRE